MNRGESIILRPFERDDLENYRRWINNSNIASLIDRVLPVSREQHEKWYNALIENKKAVVFVIETILDVCYIGNVWLWDIDARHRKAELRILVGEQEYQGKGLGTEAIKLIVRFAFDKLNLHRLYAYVLCSNERAKRAFEKAGFSIEGILKNDRFVDGKYMDVFLMAILRERG